MSSGKDAGRGCRGRRPHQYQLIGTDNRDTPYIGTPVGRWYGAGTASTLIGIDIELEWFQEMTMQPTDIAFFAGTMFLSLGTLIKWKRRRDVALSRVNRGLRGYVAAKCMIMIPVTD
jgi:hypothetical protein